MQQHKSRGSGVLLDLRPAPDFSAQDGIDGMTFSRLFVFERFGEEGCPPLRFITCRPRGVSES
jgi:hypothetical protein